MAKFTFINRFFWPDTSATSQLLSDLAFELSSQGHQVTLITSRHLYQHNRQALALHESYRGVEILRVLSTNFGRGHRVGRLVDYLTFYISTLATVLLQVGSDQVVIAKTDPPLLSIPLALIAMLKRFRFINWIQDLFPEVAISAGVPALDGALGRWLLRWRDWSLLQAQENVVIGREMEILLRTRGAPAKSLRIIWNWSPEIEVPMRENGLRTEWGLSNRFVVMYSGNLGEAHDHTTILGAMAELSHEPDIFFLFVGGGKKLDILRCEAEQRGLHNILLKPLQPRELLAESLAVGDLHLVSLRPRFDGQIVPSKYYGILNAARPMVFIGSETNEIAREIRREGIGASVRQGDVDGLVAAIRDSKDDPALRARQGAAGRRLFETAYTREASLKAWVCLLERTAQLAS